MNYSLGMKSNPFLQRQKEQGAESGGQFSLSSVIQNASNAFQNLIGSFVGGLRRLGFGVSRMLGIGNVDE